MHIFYNDRTTVIDKMQEHAQVWIPTQFASEPEESGIIAVTVLSVAGAVFATLLLVACIRPSFIVWKNRNKVKADKEMNSNVHETETWNSYVCSNRQGNRVNPFGDESIFAESPMIASKNLFSRLDWVIPYRPPGGRASTAGSFASVGYSEIVNSKDRGKGRATVTSRKVVPAPSLSFPLTSPTKEYNIATSIVPHYFLDLLKYSMPISFSTSYGATEMMLYFIRTFHVIFSALPGAWDHGQQNHRVLHCILMGVQLNLVLFVTSALAFLVYNDESSCRALTTRNQCLEVSSVFDSQFTKCSWVNNENYCEISVPYNSTMSCITVAMLAAFLSSPLRILMRWLITLLYSAIRARYMDMVKVRKYRKKVSPVLSFADEFHTKQSKDRLSSGKWHKLYLICMDMTVIALNTCQFDMKCDVASRYKKFRTCQRH